MRKRLIVGNWKLNGLREQARELTEAVQTGLPQMTDGTVVLAPPAVWLTEMAARITHPSLYLSGQNLAQYEQGAYTGEISGVMLKQTGCRYVIVGHSERRALFGEDNALVGRKVSAALAAGLIPIVCCGETLAEREADTTWVVIEAQLQAVAAAVSGADWAKLVLAYEPVWAIGTGRTASPEQAQVVHAQIRYWLRSQIGEAADGIQILYGGSVKGSNAASLLAQPDIDGALVGGASLDAREFLQIVLS